MMMMMMGENRQNKQTSCFGKQEVIGLATAQQTQAATFDTSNPNYTFPLEGLFSILLIFFSNQNMIICNVSAPG